MSDNSRTKRVGRRMGRAIAAFALSGLMVFGLTPVAFAAPAAGDTADDATLQSIADQFAANADASLQRVLDTGNYRAFIDRDQYNKGTESMALMDTANLPASYDMRSKNQVTSVKLQNPWGDCWGFAAIAASESSIISETGLSPRAVDLSELQLAWFAYQPLASGYSGTAATQTGEGLRAISSNANAGLNIGGMPFTATSILSTGAGPVPESLVPYKNAEGTIEYDDQIPFCYSADGNWSVSADKRFLSVAQLDHSAILPSPATVSNNTYTYNPAGTAAIKQEIINGRAVEIAYHADDALPGEDNPHTYLNTTTWAQYTDTTTAEADHAVCIVGWNDNYPANGYVPGKVAPGNGAWLIKNSWGAANQSFPNWNEWGINGDGYFWLSYYDQTIELPESFNYDTSDYTGVARERIVAQYDYLQASQPNSASTSTPISMANVFTASVDQNITSVATETSYPGTQVTYQLYRLNNGYTSPTDGTLLATATETYTYGGFHRYQFANDGYPMEAGDSYSVVVTQQYDGEYLIIADYAINQTGANAMSSQGSNVPYYGVGIVKQGESFLQQNGTWTDWTQVIPSLEQSMQMNGYVDYDNFSIKAYAKAADDAATEPFADVTPNDWFYNAVDFMYKRGIMTGYSGTDLFGPNAALQRQDMAIMIYRYLAPKDVQEQYPSGTPVANSTGLYDVRNDAYYTAAVNWCYSQGIMTGYGNSNYFGVGQPITRAEFATVLNRMDNAPEVADISAELNHFPDRSSVPSWAANAMAWSVQTGIIRGLNGELAPNATATRAQVAEMFWRYIELV